MGFLSFSFSLSAQSFPSPQCHLSTIHSAGEVRALPQHLLGVPINPPGQSQVAPGHTGWGHSAERGALKQHTGLLLPQTLRGAMETGTGIQAAGENVLEARKGPAGARSRVHLSRAFKPPATWRPAVPAPLVLSAEKPCSPAPTPPCWPGQWERAFLDEMPITFL